MLANDQEHSGDSEACLTHAIEALLEEYPHDVCYPSGDEDKIPSEVAHRSTYPSGYSYQPQDPIVFRTYSRLTLRLSRSGRVGVNFRSCASSITAGPLKPISCRALPMAT